MKRTKRGGINQNGGRQEQQENTSIIRLDVARRTKRVRSDIENHSFDVHLNDMSDEVSDNLVNSVEVKTRGPTNMPRVWARREQVEVEFDEHGKPIGENKNEFVEFIGTLARNGTLFPLDYADWHKVPMSTKENLFKLIKEKFCGTADLQNVSWNIVSKGWRSWKTRVKNKYFDLNASMEENLRKRPDIDDGRIELDQWKNLVIQWSTDKDRKRSAQNKGNRGNKKMMHITGKKSFSQVKYQMKKEAKALKEADCDNSEDNGDNEEDDDPSRMDLFGKCFTKNGESSNPIIVDTLKKMQEKKSELAPGSKDVGLNDIFSQVLGEDKGGRVRMCGYGITTSDVYGDIPIRGKSSRMHMTYKKEINELKQIVLEQNKKMQEFMKMNMQQASHNSPPETTRVPSPSSQYHPTTILPSTSSPINKMLLQVGAKVTLKSVFDSSKIVAIGVLQSLDPLKRVGQVLLGDKWCEIIITVAVDFDEDLVRPTSHFRTIGDSIGEVVIWPKNLVAMDQERGV